MEISPKKIEQHRLLKHIVRAVKTILVSFGGEGE
jgi:hypothetical protein